MPCIGITCCERIKFCIKRIKPFAGRKRCNQDTQEPFLHELPATITIWLLSNNFCSEIKLLRQKKKKANLWSMPLPFLSFINNLMYLKCGIYCIHEVSYSTDNKLIILADKDQTDCLMECTNIFHFLQHFSKLQN